LNNKKAGEQLENSPASKTNVVQGLQVNMKR